MSFVNLIMTEDFISVISDGQITQEGKMTESHFKKFIVSSEHFVVAVTGYQIITQEIKKKFHYQPKLSYEEAKSFLIEQLEKYQEKRTHFGQKSIAYNAVIAGFAPDLQATSFHIENQKLTSKDYQEPTVLSLPPDDINFNPNQLISQYLPQFEQSSLIPQIQSLQRNLLYRVAEQSQTVNRTVFQEIIKKS